MSFNVDDPLHEATLEDLLRLLILEQRITNMHLAQATDLDNDTLRTDAAYDLQE